PGGAAVIIAVVAVPIEPIEQPAVQDQLIRPRAAPVVELTLVSIHAALARSNRRLGDQAAEDRKRPAGAEIRGRRLTLDLHTLHESRHRRLLAAGELLPDALRGLRGRIEIPGAGLFQQSRQGRIDHREISRIYFLKSEIFDPLAFGIDP